MSFLDVAIPDMLILVFLQFLQGFDYHVRNEHNMWSYVFFFIHLNDMKTSDYTAIELFVSKLVSKITFFKLSDLNSFQKFTIADQKQGSSLCHTVRLPFS